MKKFLHGRFENKKKRINKSMAFLKAASMIY
jgi:hypothetical protein